MWKHLPLLVGVLLPAAVWAASSVPLNITVDADGVAHIQAILSLPATRDVVHAVLTDYLHWPLLFAPGLRIEGIKPEKDGVQTDLYLPRHFLPGEFHLVTITRETTPGMLETTLIDGDFMQYRRTWMLTAGGGSSETHAELRMDIQLKQWIPAWLLTFVLKHELLEHFDRLRHEVQFRNSRLTPSVTP